MCQIVFEFQKNYNSQKYHFKCLYFFPPLLRHLPEDARTTQSLPINFFWPRPSIKFLFVICLQWLALLVVPETSLAPFFISCSFLTASVYYLPENNVPNSFLLVMYKLALHVRVFQVGSFATNSGKRGT